MALTRSLGSSQSAVRPSDEESSDRGSETLGGGAPSTAGGLVCGHQIFIANLSHLIY